MSPNGIPQAIRDVGHDFVRPNLEQVNREVPAPCAGGIPECALLRAADYTGTDLLQKFLTQVDQGLNALQTIVRQCATYYENGRDDSVAALNAVDTFFKQGNDPSLPNKSGVFEHPHPLSTS